MKEISNFIGQYNLEIILGLSLGLILSLILGLASLITSLRTRKKYKKLLMGKDGLDIEGLLMETGENIGEILKDLQGLKNQIEGLETKQAFGLQKVGFVRYNAFSDMGSELSYSIALLDNFKNGFVLTSIYGRDHATTYAKPIKFGKSKYPLSVEEIQAIDRAIMGEAQEKKLN